MLIHSTRPKGKSHHLYHSCPKIAIFNRSKKFWWTLTLHSQIWHEMKLVVLVVKWRRSYSIDNFSTWVEFFHSIVRCKSTWFIIQVLIQTSRANWWRWATKWVVGEFSILTTLLKHHRQNIRWWQGGYWVLWNQIQVMLLMFLYYLMFLLVHLWKILIGEKQWTVRW